MLKAGDGARCNAGAVLQPLGGDAGQGCAAHSVACTFPRFARNSQHRALAGSRIADHDREALAVGCMFECRFLLAREDQAALGRADKRGVSLHIIDGVTGALRQCVCGAIQALFGLDHCPRREAILPASVLAQRNQVGRCAHRIVGGIELIFAVAMPVNEGGKIAPGEGRLLVGDRIQRQRRVGDDPLTIALGNRAVFLDTLGFQSTPANA